MDILRIRLTVAEKAVLEKSDANFHTLSLRHTMQ